MKHSVAVCAFCGAEVGIDRDETMLDPGKLVFETNGEPKPCPHLVWVELSVTNWELRTNGSTQPFGDTLWWESVLWRNGIDVPGLSDYMTDLLHECVAEDFRPSCEHVTEIEPIEEKALDARGEEYETYEVEGWVVFAKDAKAFVEQAKQQASGKWVMVRKELGLARLVGR
jgi:hypothetical protein